MTIAVKAKDLVTSPAYTVISAADKFEHPTTRVNQLWQTDFTYLKIVHWGWHYLSTVLDDYSRYIIAWRLCNTMKADDVKVTLDVAIAKTGVTHVHVYKQPRLLSDNVLNLESRFFFGYTDPCLDNSISQAKTQVTSTVIR